MKLLTPLLLTALLTTTLQAERYHGNTNISIMTHIPHTCCSWGYANAPVSYDLVWDDEALTIHFDHFLVNDVWGFEDVVVPEHFVTTVTDTLGIEREMRFKWTYYSGWNDGKGQQTIGVIAMGDGIYLPPEIVLRDDIAVGDKGWWIGSDSVPVNIPEPSGLALLLGGVFCWAWRRR